jgi:hypothetical protein
MTNLYVKNLTKNNLIKNVLYKILSDNQKILQKQATQIYFPLRNNNKMNTIILIIFNTMDT